MEKAQPIRRGAAYWYTNVNPEKQGMMLEIRCGLCRLFPHSRGEVFGRMYIFLGLSSHRHFVCHDALYLNIFMHSWSSFDAVRRLFYVDVFSTFDVVHVLNGESKDSSNATKAF